MRKLLRYLKHYKKESIIGPLFKLLEACFELIVPLVMANIIDIGIKNQDMPYIWKMGAVLVLFGVLGLACSLTAQYFAAKAAVGFGTELRHDLFAHINSLSYAEIDQAGSATLVTRMTSDINQGQSGVNLVLRLFLRSPFIVVGAMIMAFTISVKAALIFVVAVPLLAIVIYGIMMITIPLYKKVQRGLDGILLSTRENLSGIRVVRAFCTQKREIETFAEENSSLLDVQMLVGKLSALLNPATYIIVNVATIAIVWFGGKQVYVGNISQGEVIALVNYMSQILLALIALANLIVSFTKALASASRINEVFELTSDIVDGEYDREESNKENMVIFDEVSMSYSGAEEAISNISFVVKRGETVGVIGGTGSGKSTLVNLIPRFYDVTKGQILVNGENVKNYKIETLRKKIGVVPQKAVLFRGTIRDNMKMGNENATDEMIYRALETAQAMEVVEKKKEGLDAKISQNGKNLSGGQKQRLTIARALVKNPEILILDDSASALDFATDARLRKAIASLYWMTAKWQESEHIRNCFGPVKFIRKFAVRNSQKRRWDIMRKHHGTIKRVGKLLLPYLHYLILSLVFAVITVGFTLYAPILIGDAVDFIVGKGQVDFGKILQILVKLAVIIGVTSVAQWLMNLCNNQITYRVVKDVRMNAFEHLQKLPLKYVDSHPYGETISRIITDVEQFSDGLLMGFSQLFTGVVTIAGTLAFMLSINVKISLIVIFITPLSLFVASFVAKKTYNMFKIQSETRAQMTSLVDEMVGNQKVVQAFGYGKRSLERFDTINEELKTCSIRAIFFSSITNPSTRFVNGLVYSGVGIFGAVLAMQGVITVGQLSCFLTYANQYTKPFNEISSVLTEIQNAFACAKRVFDFIDEEVETKDKEGALILQQTDGSMELQHISFSYRKDTPLLKDLNLHVKQGQKVAIVGPTGCGKTTLINLLMRFYDIDAGKIYVSGHDVKEITKDSLRANFGMVLQDTWLKSGTIAENIAYGKPEATRAEIIEAAKAAHAHGFIKRMSDGYDTVISEDGGNLSQGQKQFLCIARVMLKLPPILILDEATSSIDTRTEIKIQEAFQKMMEGRTSFIVAHRLSTIKEADIILVMKDGNIVEQGNHEELLARNGFYAKLYQSQFA